MSNPIHVPMYFVSLATPPPRCTPTEPLDFTKRTSPCPSRLRPFQQQEQMKRWRSDIPAPRAAMDRSGYLVPLSTWAKPATCARTSEELQRRTWGRQSAGLLPVRTGLVLLHTRGLRDCSQVVCRPGISLPTVYLQPTKCFCIPCALEHTGFPAVARPEA